MPDWKVPGYTELSVLGSGSFGEVMLARHDESGLPVAIKYLRPDLLTDQGFAAMFRAEAELLASLDDPNVVRLYEYVESPSGAAIVMELIDGVTLRAILTSQGHTTPEAALVVLQGSLLGLAAAHRQGVVHRDYKPENVLVNGDGASKLTDFGIAVRAGDAPLPAGTLWYAAPEQMAGAPPGPASDVYSATVTFYECLTGQPPFTGDTGELLLQHHSEPVPLDPVPEQLRPLVAAGTAKEPERRPADGTTLVAELRNAAAGAYGQDWEERGRSHLGEAAVLLAALWPAAQPPAVQGSAEEQLHLHHDNAGTKKSAHPRHPRHLRHLAHLRHPAYLADPRRIRSAWAAMVAVAVVALLAAIATFAFRSTANAHPTAAPVRSVSLNPTSAPSSSAPSIVPLVSGLSPASGSTAGGTVVTITGTHLDGPVTVMFGAKAGTISVDLNTKITVKSPPGQGTVEITVTTPAGSGKAGEFSYHSPNAPTVAPVVTSISQEGGPADGGTPVIITGTGLADATVVSFGGAAGIITADSGTQIAVNSPPGNGTVTVSVTTLGGTATAGTFTYSPAPSPTPVTHSTTPPPSSRPVVTGFSPTSGPIGGGTRVTISGRNLSGATGVSFGRAGGGSITADSSTRITVTSPAGSGSVTVTVTTAGGTATAGTFTYSPGPSPSPVTHSTTPPPPPAQPVVTGFSPTSGPIGGGTPVTITGENLSDASEVSFGSAGDGSVTADSSTAITVTSPAGSGSVSVTVTTAGGTVTAGTFTYVVPPPTVTRYTPTTGNGCGGTTVDIFGSNLSGASVSFGDVSGTVTSDSGSEIVVTAPSGSQTVTITVTTPGGTVTVGSFSYQPCIELPLSASRRSA
jgi:eukaryotic-like serine/threonine-protein kinase